MENLTTNLLQSTIEVQDFSKSAVQCFLEAAYSGDIKKLSSENFRDVNKMGHVFEVDWLVEKCGKYFEHLTETVTLEDYVSQEFVFQEAVFMWRRLKKRNFVDLVVKKFSSLLCCTGEFVTRYLRDISSCPTASLDVIIEMVGKEEDILIRVVVNQLENNRSVIDPNTRYILERLKFMSCQAAHRSLYRELIEKLEGVENPSKEDFKLIVRILKCCSNALFEKTEKTEALSLRVVPNLFHDIGELLEINDLDTLTTLLVESPIVTNSCIFYDAVYSWLDQKSENLSTPFVTIPDTLVNKFSDIMTSRGWSPLPREYIDVRTKKYKCFGGLTDKIVKNVNMITDSQYSRILSISEYTVDELFGRDHDIKFNFKKHPTKKCSKEGECGFILRVTAASGKQDSSFNIQLVIDPDLYPDDLHFHKESSSWIENCHFCLDITKSGGYDYIYKDKPVTWNTRPCRDGTNKYWCWGVYWFFSEPWLYSLGEGQSPPGYIHTWGRYYGSTARIRPVVYLFG